MLIRKKNNHCIASILCAFWLLLQLLAMFQQSHPRVVYKLWDLRDKKKVVEANKVHTDLPQPASAAQNQLAKFAAKVKNAVSVASQSAGMSTSTTTGSGGTSTDNVGTQAHGQGHDVGVQGGEDMDTTSLIEVDITEDELVQDHKKVIYTYYFIC